MMNFNNEPKYIITLIKNLQDGKMSSFDEFYELTKKQILINIYGIIKDEDLSQDVLQDTYIKFLETISTIDVEKNPISYLYTISTNIAIDYIKKRKNVSYVDMESKEEFIGDNCKENDESNYSDLLNVIKSILKTEEFDIVLLHVVNELTFKEIAEIKGKPLGTILWQYNSSVKKVQKKLERRK